MSSAVTSASRRKGWACIRVRPRTWGGRSITRRSTCRPESSTRSPGGRVESPLHQHPRGLAEALVAPKRRILEPRRSEEAPVLLELQPHAERHAREPLATSLALGFRHEGPRHAPAAAPGMDREPADVEGSFVLVPQDDTDDRAVALQNGPAPAAEVIDDGGGGLPERARRRLPPPRLALEREPDQGGGARPA